MAVFTQDKIINDLIPFIQKILPNEEDEVLLAISEEVINFKNYLDEKNIHLIFPLFQFLFGCEESVVRESAIEKMRILVDSLDEAIVQKYLVPLILNIATLEGFQWKVSAIYLIRMCYQKSGKDKEKLRSLYFKLCDDDTPIIKRTAAKEFGPLCLILEKKYLSTDMIPYYKMFMNESDIIRVTILPSLVQLTNLSKNVTDLQRTSLQFIVAASDDMSWRVRNQLCQLFPEIANYLGKQINELIPTLSILINDSETEVKISALKSLNLIIKKISSERIVYSIIPAFRNLSNETSKDVKANIGESLGPIAAKIGYSAFNSNLGVVMDTLMKDENPDVRLGVAKSMFQIFKSSEGSLITSTNAFLGTMQKDSQYRVRECVYTTLAKLGELYNLDVFKSTIEPLFFNYITDSVSSVRLAGINSLRILIEKFGNNWVNTSLIPKLQSFLLQNKSSYLNRMCVLNSLAVCGEYMEPKSINELLLPLLLKNLKDKIPNVRFFTIKLFQTIYPKCDSEGKEKISMSIKPMIGDEDCDVREYAKKFLDTK